MSRTTSLTFREAVNAQETDEIFLVLVTINHDDLASPLRFVNNNENVTSNGNVFTAYPFEITLPDDTVEHAPTCKLRIDNVARDLVTAIRSISSPLDMTIQVILASDPDTIEVEYSDFKLVDVSYDAFTIEGTISIEGFAHEQYPGRTFLPSNFPGLF
jgi:hypothetical protein